MQVMMQVGFYGHVRQYKNIQSEIDANIRRVLESGEYVQGPMLKQFEQELAAFHETKHAIGVGNGTDAIWLALMAMGIGPGDEVITHPNTFFATAEAIWIAGATAVFVDCDPKTKCIDPSIGEEFIHPGPFFRQEPRSFLIALWIMDIDLFMCNIVISAENNVGLFLSQCLQVSKKFIEPLVFKSLAFFSRGT